MKIKLYLKAALEKLWQEDKKCFRKDAEITPACLRCGGPMARRIVKNAISRHAGVCVCDVCGTDEALRDVIGEPLPLREWFAVTNGRVKQVLLDGPGLTPVCSFSDIFVGPKKAFPLNSVERPVSEVAYLRSDYDGHQWWRTWFHCVNQEIEAPLAEEMDQFSSVLMEMPEFGSLDAMGRMCRSCAQPTSSPTDFNLYSETEHFYIWLQMVTRERDYNLYVHFYLRKAASGWTFDGVTQFH